MVGQVPWWRDAVVYQVYIRSFADGDGDGTGDIAGLTSRLPYIASLGVDAVWLNPWYESPLSDGGYDVADYRSIDPRFGNVDEAVNFIGEAKAHGLRVLLDLVPNHTSSEHPWFEEALSAPPGSPPRHRYHFLPGKGPDGSRPPNNWRSVFGGPAWTRVPDGEWYLHLFDVTQPDLNWGNSEVRSEFLDIIRFWLDRGASGFRVDVANALDKHPEYPDLVQDDESVIIAAEGIDHPFWDRDLLHEVVREWRSVVDQYPDAILVAEAWVSSWKRLALYLRPDEYHQAFDFRFMLLPWDRNEFKEAIETALEGADSVGSMPTWVLSNHDVVRHATRYALPTVPDARDWLLQGDRSLLDEEGGLRRARAAILLMLGLPGSAYLYQGEELGLPEVHDLPIEVLDDPVWERSRHTEKGRDGSRVPIPWSREGESFGFGSDGSWLPQPEDWAKLSVEAQDGVPGSTLELYRSALRLRLQYLAGVKDLDWVEAGPGVLCFRRQRLTIMVNYGTRPAPLPQGELLIASEDLEGDVLPPDTAAWITD